MRRRLVGAGLVLAAALAPLLAAAPAYAGGGIGCTGPSCSISLTSLIHLSGDEGSGSSEHVPVSVAPPPCLWEPMGDAIAGSNAVIAQSGPDPSDILGIPASVKQAKALLKDPVPGEWYLLPVNPAASPAGVAECLKLPLYFFAQPGDPLPTPPIPDKTLADFAYNHMNIPVPTVVANPRGKGYVNLGTYVWGDWAPSRVTNRTDAYKITAELGNQIVTVWAAPAASGAFTVSADGPGTAYSDCGPTGSHFPLERPPAGAGAGTPPDCGVLWQGPDASAGVSAAVRWTVTWGAGDLNGPGPNALPAITMTGPADEVPVGEIQSINGG